MSIYYYLHCLENGQKLDLGGLDASEDKKLNCFFPGLKANREERYTSEEAKEAIVQFLARNIGKTFALVQDDDIAMISSVVDYYDDKGDGTRSFRDNRVSIEELLNVDETFDPYDNMGIRGKLSPMVIDCIDKTVSRFDWMPVMDTIFDREENKDYAKEFKSFFYWGKKEEAK